MVFLAALAGVVLGTTRMGLALNVPRGGGVDQLVAAMKQEKTLGLDGNQMPLKWDEYESQNGKPLTDGLNSAKFMGQEILLTISTIDTSKKRLPADVASLAWDDPKLWDRFDGFLAKITPQFGGQVKWISLGNEVEIYLGRNSKEQEAYIKFLAHSRATLHKLVPGIPIGVTTSWGGFQRQSQVIRDVQEGSDIVVFTYYPMFDLSILPPEQVVDHFKQMLRVAGDRPLVLQEIGFPSSAACGSNEAFQSKFVENVFHEIKAHQDKIPFASYFIMSDLSSEKIQEFANYYRLDDPGFKGFISSLGLKEDDGKPKPAWDTFTYELKKLRKVGG